MSRCLAPRQIENLATEIERLRTLTGKQLDERWRELFGSERPRRLYGELLIGVLAYRLQEKAAGGLKPATRRLLRQVAEGSTQRHMSVSFRSRTLPQNVRIFRKQAKSGQGRVAEPRIADVVITRFAGIFERRRLANRHRYGTHNFLLTKA